MTSEAKACPTCPDCGSDKRTNYNGACGDAYLDGMGRWHPWHNAPPTPERCKTCGGKPGPDSFETDTDTGKTEAACGDPFHDAPPSPDRCRTCGNRNTRGYDSHGAPCTSPFHDAPPQPAPSIVEAIRRRSLECLSDIDLLRAMRESRSTPTTRFDDAYAALLARLETLHLELGRWERADSHAAGTLSELLDEVQPAPAGFEADHDWRRQMEAYGYDSVAVVAGLIAAAEKRGEMKYRCDAAKDCHRHPMFCGTHHLQIRDHLMAESRAAGIEEGRKAAFVEAWDRLRNQTDRDSYFRWLASRAGEE